MLRRTMMTSSKFRIIDIGVNLTDPVFKGLYRGKQAHQNDFNEVISRAEKIGVEKMIITVGRQEESNDALELCKTNSNFFCTIGCHPTRCNEFEEHGSPDEYYKNLLKIALDNKDKVIAIGECGLDYDRIQFCQPETQRKYFEKQFDLAVETKLPMFLHMRNAADDFVDIFRRHKDSISGGVAHCFTGTTEEAKRLMDLGLYIGITGCSLRTADNLETLKEIPTEYLMIETDAPWCDIRNTHAGSKYIKTKYPMKKKERWETGHCVYSRNEPCHIIQVLEVMAGVRGEDPFELADSIFCNTENFFFHN